MRTEHRIIWTDSQVRAILNTKIGASPGEAIDPSQPALWQARRPFLHQPAPDVDEVIFDAETATATFPTERGKRVGLRCPFGVPGDLLWGAECWAGHAALDDYRPVDLEGPAWFRADGHGPDPGQKFRLTGLGSVRSSRGQWRSSMQMPRDFARIWHEVVSVRAERLDTAFYFDAYAEGLGKTGEIKWVTLDNAAYRAAWVADRGAEFVASNPWTWVLGLRRVDHA